MDFFLCIFLTGCATFFAYCVFVPLLTARVREKRWEDAQAESRYTQSDCLPEGAFAALLPDRSIPLTTHTGAPLYGSRRNSLDR